MKFINKYAGYLFLVVSIIFIVSVYFIVLKNNHKIELKEVEETTQMLEDKGEEIDIILNRIEKEQNENKSNIDQILKELKL